MRISAAIALVFAFCLFHSSLATSPKGIPGYIFNADKTSTNNLLKETLSPVVYNHHDVNSLLLHNLGLLHNVAEVPESTKELISQHGNKNIMSQQKINFAFFVESKSAQPLVENGKKVYGKPAFRHQPVLFGLEDVHSNMFNQLYNTQDEKSAVNRLSKFAGKTPEAFIYSTDAKTAEDFPASALLSATNSKGNIYIVDKDQTNKFKISSDLNTCVNTVLKGQFTVDIEKGTITSVKNAETPVFVANDKTRDGFVQLMNDVCSVAGISALIRRDPNPSLFTFHISSLGALEKVATEDESAVLRQVFGIAYEKFVQNVLAQYKADEVSGQVLFVEPQVRVPKAEVFVQLGDNHYKSARVLAEGGVTTRGLSTSLADTMDPTTNVIFKSILVVFVLVIAWVCIEMFRIDIQQDSVVYAKFLAADYFRR